MDNDSRAKVIQAGSSDAPPAQSIDETGMAGHAPDNSSPDEMGGPPRFLRLVSAEASVANASGDVEDARPAEALSIITPGAANAAMLDGRVQAIKADPLTALAEFAEAAGYGPQHRQLLATVIAGVSAAAKSPVNLLILGDFSDGKSTVGHAAVQLLGRDFMAATSAVQKATPAALVRMGSQITGHCVLFDERDRKESELESAIRATTSGQRVTRIISVKGEPVELHIDPPVAIVDLALLDRPISLQDRSRYLGIRMGADHVTRDAVSTLSVERYTLQGRRRAVLAADFAVLFQAFLAGLSGSLQVVVPFADRVRLRTASRFRDRLVNNVLNAVSTVAWLRQTGRPQHHDNQLGAYIEAAPEDYDVVYGIVMAVGDDGSDGELSDNALTVFRCWSAWARSNGSQGRTRDRFNEITGGILSPWQTYRALRELAEAGYASGPSGRGKMGQWRLTDLGLSAEHPNLFQLLPSPAEIAATLQNCKTSS